jgi:hypothetical protein
MIPARRSEEQQVRSNHGAQWRKRIARTVRVSAIVGPLGITRAREQLRARVVSRNEALAYASAAPEGGFLHNLNS